MRAIAALSVAGSHSWLPALAGGFYGVDMFFVLSGFLITRLLYDEYAATGRVDLPRFFLRRFLRLTPPLLALLAAYLVIAPFAWPEYSPWAHLRDAALTAFYLSDYARAFWGAPHVLQHSWSLGVEEHFYLIWPLVFLALLRLPARWRLTALFCLYVAATSWRMINEDDTSPWRETYFRFDTRASGLILGALIATALDKVDRIPEQFGNVAGAFAVYALALALMVGRWQLPSSLEWTMTLAEFGAAALLIAASAPRSWVSRLLSTPPLVALGILSYGIYLWHYPAAYFFRERLPWYETLPIVLLIAVPMAGLSHVLLERPLRGFRRSLKPLPPPEEEPDAAVAPSR